MGFETGGEKWLEAVEREVSRFSTSHLWRYQESQGILYDVVVSLGIDL